MPIGPAVQYAEEKKWDNLKIRVYPGADGKFVLYEDENDNYNYEKGMYATTTFSWDDKKRTLTISDRNGSFPGMLNSRKFSFVLVTASKGGEGITVVEPDAEVTYSGKKVTVKL